MRILISILLLALASVARAQPLVFERDLVLAPAGTEGEIGRVCDLTVAPDGTVFVADWGFQL